MKIDHVAVYVDDLERAKNFWVKYFGATANDMYHNPITGLKTYFLTFGSDCRLEIMSRPDMEKTGRPVLSKGYAHVAMSVGCREQVDMITHRLQGDGYTVLSGPRVTGDGYYESCVLDAEGNVIEITE